MTPPFALEAREKSLPDRQRLLLRRAKERVEKEYLRRWWCKKYRRPPTDPTYLAYTPEDLMLEYLEDAVESGRTSEDSVRQVEVRHLPDGTPVFKTGDPEIDRLEQEFAREAMNEIEESQRKGVVQKHVPKPREDDANGLDFPDEDLLG